MLPFLIESTLQKLHSHLISLVIPRGKDGAICRPTGVHGRVYKYQHDCVYVNINVPMSFVDHFGIDKPKLRPKLNTLCIHATRKFAFKLTHTHACIVTQYTPKVCCVCVCPDLHTPKVYACQVDVRLPWRATGIMRDEGLTPSESYPYHPTLRIILSGAHIRRVLHVEVLIREV